MTRQRPPRPNLSAFTTFAFVPLILLLALLTPAANPDRTQGCLWDRDTLYMEAKGLTSLTQVITGRFDRFPPLYYEMRLDRITQQHIRDPNTLKLADYDDAAVACDRLGKGDDAIEWMRRKAAALDAAKAKDIDTGDHRYRYLANLGTFHAHRWLRGGVDRSDLTDLEQARDLIAQAIELNPDAHFGRERYQLLAIEWLLGPPDFRDVQNPSIFSSIDESIPLRAWGRNRLKEVGYDDAPAGLAGLIVLGNAWESPDIFNSLAFALADEGNSAISYLAVLRVKELVGEGRISLRPPFEEEFEEGNEWMSQGVSGDYVKNQIDSYYPRARKEAESWRTARNAFILAKLESGLHPDTNADFWNDWKEPSRPPALPGLFNQYQLIGIAFVAILVSFILLITWLVVARVKRLFPFRKREQQLLLPT
jgi:tetratricopeptide (TPR) repeat protein